MCDESVRGDKNWVFNWIVILEVILKDTSLRILIKLC